MNLENLTKICLERTDNLFNLYLTNQTYPAKILQQAIAYAVLNGGKRIRPLLVYATGLALDVPWENLDAPACAIELIHAYSLIHDDLPAMDNSDLRRGKPSCHKAFNEAMAILAGDALQPLAFEIIAAHPSNLEPSQRLAMIHILCHACGPHGMVAGQVLDIAGINSEEALAEMYRLKTGALLTASVKLGMLAANQSFVALEKFAENIGLAFQIQDDLLDIEKHTDEIGKPQGIDVVNKKTTYPTLLGIDKTRTKIQTLFTEALASIEFLGEKGNLLRELANSLMQRKK